MKYAIGIDIGGTNTVFGIVSEVGECIAEDRMRTDAFDDAEEYVRVLTAGIQVLLRSNAEALERDGEVIGIGIGAPNGNYYKGTVENAPNLKWKGVIPLADMIKEFFNLPVVLTNDANAAAIGEMIFGAAKGMKDFFVITLGTGLGSGFVANGKMIYGHTGFAGELGHMIIFENGRMCGCGRKGCLETYASATGIVKTVKKMLRNSNEESILRDMDFEEITSKKIYEAAKKGDKIALDAFDYTGKILALGLANAVAITSPEAIILLGGLTQSGDYIFNPAKKYFEEYLLNNFKGTVKLLPSAISGKNAAVLGAAAMVFSD
ncbi:MAG: ROK family protein [Ignavibacteria bacterium]|nr:ROK family protein [Ignavibacteria bacterium]